MSDLQKWIDLRGSGEGSKLKIHTLEGDDGRQRRYLYVTGLKNDSVRWQGAIEKLGFTASPGKKYLVRQVRDGESIKASDFRSVWPNATLAEMPRDQILLDIKPIRQTRQGQTERTQEEKDVSVEAGVVQRLGRNADGDEVFSGTMGRYVLRSGGAKVYETDLLGPATFLRAPDAAALNSCADGFVKAMLSGEVQHSEDLDRFIRAVTGKELPFAPETYEEVAIAVDAAMVRFLNGTYDTAQDAFGDAARLYDYLPPYKGSAKGLAAMPLPMAVIAQRLLGDTKDRHVLVPNAWDGASFAFMSPGSRIHAFRGTKDLSRNVSSVRAEDVSWHEVFDPAREQGADGLFFNADPLAGADGTRQDYKQALAALRTLNADGRAVFVLAGDNPLEPGVVSAQSLDFFRALSRRYDIESVVEMGAELTGRLGTGSSLRLISVRNRAPGESEIQLDRLHVVHDWDELKSFVDEAIATINLREAQTESIDVERTAAGNDFQRPYVAFSKVGEARTMVPKNLQGPLQHAMSSLEAANGPVDAFVESEMGFGPNTLGERFSPEQVDAVGLGIAKMKTGRGIIIGDETGIGKGRTLSGYCTWAEKRGRNVIFVTDRANLFSDLVRDLKDIGEWGRFRPFIMNADGVLVDVFTNEVIQKGTPTKVMNKILEDGLRLEELQCNMIYATYSQISGEDSVKAEWLLSQSDNAFVVVDEAHVAAGSSSNTSMAIAELVNRAWAVAYSSATWAKTSENLHIYSRAFPETVNIASLTSTMRTGGEAFSEVFSAMLARDGAFIRREHDLSKIEFNFEVDKENRPRNEALSDKIAEILASMTYVSGDINRLLMKLNSDTMKKLKSARATHALAAVEMREQARVTAARAAAATDGAPAAVPLARGSIMRSSFGAGSVLYQVMRRFLTVLNADNVTALAMKAIQENRKPVIVFEDTGEVFLRRVIQQEIIPGIEGEGDILPSMVRAPTIKDLLGNVIRRMGVITIEEVDQNYIDTPAQRRDTGEDSLDDEVDIDSVVADQDAAVSRGRRLEVLELPGLTRDQQAAYEEGMKEIIRMISELPPMPLNSIDVVQARLAEAGLAVGEISGRSLRLEPGEDCRGLAVTDPAWETAKLNIKHRSKKKVDVNSTVFGFNSGALDAIFINRSAATGISLHASPRFADVRRRELIEMQIPEDPTNRIQLYGRVNRYDQVVTPRISIATTGIFGEVRQVMMQNKKLARLSANIRSSRDNAAEIKDVPDLLNSVGREVCLRFLEENGGIRHRLGITEHDLEGRADLAQRLTSRVALLSVAEQRMVYEEVYAMFDDTLLRYELQGENPLKPREKDIRAKVLDSRIVIGVEMDGFGSAFDGPVYLKHLEWTEAKRPYAWKNVIDLVKDGREKMLADGLLVAIAQPQPHPTAASNLTALMMLSAAQPEADAAGGTQAVAEIDANLAVLESPLIRATNTRRIPSAPTRYIPAGYTDEQLKELELDEAKLPQARFGAPIEKLIKIMSAKVMIELAGSKFATVEEALAAPNNNGVKRAHAKRLWVEKHMGRLIPGCLLGLPPEMLGQLKVSGTPGQMGFIYEWGVVSAVKAPPRGREAMISGWKIDVLLPGKTLPTPLSLGTLMEGSHYDNTNGGNVSSEVLVQGACMGATAGEGDWGFHRRETVMSHFARENSRSMTRRGYVMDGNMYLASEWASSTKMGGGVVFTDDRGVRHRAIWLNARYAENTNLFETMPIRLWSRAMVEGYLREVTKPVEEGGAEPNGPGGTYLIPTSFQAATAAGQANSEVGTRVMILPGKAVALVVDKGDLGRMTRALRGYQKSQLRKAHPDYKTLSPEDKALVDAQFVKISTSAKKRGNKPVIFISCESSEDFTKVSDLLCSAAGIEMYLPRGSALGFVAQRIQANFFTERRNKALLEAQQAEERRTDAGLAPGQPALPAPLSEQAEDQRERERMGMVFQAG